MNKDQIVVALDLGSTKFTAVVASLNQNKTSVIGAYSVKSRGVKDGVINNIDKAVEGISEVLDKVQMMSGHAVSRVVTTVSGTHIESQNSHGVIAVSGENHEIVVEDMVRVNEAARAVSLPSSREVLHVIPREYIVDKQRGITEPQGLTGFRLEVESNIIHGSSTVIKNLTKCISQVGVEIDQLVYSGYASSQAVLTDTEKELGAMLLDIGGGTIDMVIYTKGSPAYSAVLPIGGQSITNDIAIEFRTLLENAEKIKLKLSLENDLASKNVKVDRVGKEAKIAKNDLYVGDLNIGIETVSKGILEEVIAARLVECFKFVQIYIKKAGYERKLPAGIVLTGGTAKIKGIERVAEQVFRLPVRVGNPDGLYGLVDQIQGPEYSAVIGCILQFASDYKHETSFSSVKHDKIKDIPNRIISLIKSFLP